MIKEVLSITYVRSLKKLQSFLNNMVQTWSAIQYFVYLCVMVIIIHS